MAKIIIIGNSAAGFSACQALVNCAGKHELSVVSKEDYPAYRKDLFVEYLSGSRQEKDLFLAADDYYKSNSITFYKAAEVTRVDTKKKSLTLKDKNKLEYDYLVIASGQKASVPDLPGKTKEGIFCFYELEDVKKVREKLVLPGTVCVAGEEPFAVSLARAIAAKGKDVKLVGKGLVPLPEEQANIEIVGDSGLQEFIGESTELQAIKLSSGKVIAVSLAVITGNYAAPANFCKESEIRNSGGYIIVDSALRTNIEGIFACGSVAVNEAEGHRQKSWQDCVNEGALAAQGIIDLIGRGEAVCQKS